MSEGKRAMERPFRRIIVATRNPGKLEEIRRLVAGLPIEWEMAGGPPVEETGDTYLENATIKAVAASLHAGLPAIAEDSGIEVDALGGKPGIHSARYAKGDRACNERLLREIEGIPTDRRSCRYRCVVVLVEGGKVVFQAEGVCEGRVAPAPRGTGGFGYDPIFLVPPYRRTMAELSPADKNRLSHRGKAFRKLVRFLRARCLRNDRETIGGAK